MSWRFFPYNRQTPLPEYRWGLDTIHSPLPGIWPWIKRKIIKIISWPVKVVLLLSIVWEQFWFEPLRPGRSEFRHPFFDFGHPKLPTTRLIDEEHVLWEQRQKKKKVDEDADPSEFYDEPYDHPTEEEAHTDPLSALGVLYGLPPLEPHEMPPIRPKDRFATLGVRRSRRGY